MMREWTEQEEQQMIARAKAGDAEANYEMSLWALQRGEEEPDEPRWNRLAAKCLVRSAQAGYAPAQAKMAALLHQAEPPQQPRRTQSRPEPEERTMPEPVPISNARQGAQRSRTAPPAQQTTARTRQPAPRTPAPPQPARRRAYRQEEDDYDQYDDGYEDEYDDYDDGYEDEYDDGYDARRRARAARGQRRERPARDRREKRDRRSGGLFSSWGDRQWRIMEIVCIVICVVLAGLIAVMLFTGKGDKADSAEAPSGVPAANVADPAQEPTPSPEPYPSEDIRAEIMAADLEIVPDDLDYVTGPTTATVSSNSAPLKLRKGPNTTYDPITDMADGTVLEVFADKNAWRLVRFNGDTWGWCSNQYLIIDQGAVSAG